MPKELINGQGHVAWAATHSAYGKVIATADGGHFEGEPSDATNGVESPFRLLGQVNDEDAELCWTLFRCFDAERDVDLDGSVGVGWRDADVRFRWVANTCR